MAPKILCLAVLLVGAVPGPARARTLQVGLDAPTLQATVHKAASGDVVQVPGGTWRGPLIIDKPLTVRGPGIVDGRGSGSVIRIQAPRVVLENLTIQNSGKDLGAPDACVYLSAEAANSQVKHNRLRNCGFGIWIHETKRVRIVKNRVAGSLRGHRSNRGNGIHLFNASDLTISDNVIHGGRDGIYVSATEHSLIADNRVSNTRYGVHYMYSHGNRLSSNVVRASANGYALMESRNIVVVGNKAVGNEEHGILFRDAQGCTILGNYLEGNGEGLFFYSSTENVIQGNRIRRNTVGARIWAGSVRNHVSGNAFIGNGTQIFYVASQDLVWGKRAPGNAFSDYLGWDQDGDGLGDRPYRANSFLSALVYRYPATALLMRSPALELLAHLEEHFPLLRKPTVYDYSPIIDEASVTPQKASP